MINQLKISLLFCLMLAFTSVDAQENITQQKYQLPLLIGKDFNPVLRLAVNISKDKTLNELEINVPTNGADIDQVQLFALDQDTTFITSAKLEKLSPIATVNGNSSKVLSLELNKALKSGQHFFWLTLKLKSNADLQHKINLTIGAVVLDGKKVKVTPLGKTISQYVAVALRQHNQENIHTHRIPGIATAKDGSLLAVYDARRTKGGDLQGDIDIGLSRSVDKGKTWLPMQVVLDMGAWGGLPEKFNGVSDACILVDKNTGDIFVAGLWMYGVINKDGKWVEGLNEQSTDWNHQWRDRGSQPGFDVKQTSQFMITKSSDNGKTWSKPINITKMCKKEEWWLWAPAPGAGITLKDGTLVFPTQGRDATGKPFSNITYSKDHGVTWQTSNAATEESTTENMAVELADGSVMLNMRANSNRTDTSENNGRAIAVTKDLGKNWTIHPTSHKALQEPTCMASILRHDYTVGKTKKSILLFCNPDSKVARNYITLKMSNDDGKSWERKMLFDEWKGRGYSCITSVDEETIGVLYESSQADLVFQTVKLKDLL
ncbi:exo-alpha-sialidase [Pedobacter sp. MC2016-05]|uniref:sialidase family protein n=1 Tax=Pedobacter sp. MC2016-05 TaxID=2994474 RepID=UPI0022451B0F|nr:sialidase family protein [Pedobacter sp. MC2016-05]MCX2474953.1 exo-alpha-sialidase [Pedobacter sp. MC2016-05]